MPTAPDNLDPDTIALFLDVDRIFDPAVFPVAGAHGTEIRGLDGQTVSAADQSLPADVADVLTWLREAILAGEPQRRTGETRS